MTRCQSINARRRGSSSSNEFRVRVSFGRHTKNTPRASPLTTTTTWYLLWLWAMEAYRSNADEVITKTAVPQIPSSVHVHAAVATSGGSGCGRRRGKESQRSLHLVFSESIVLDGGSCSCSQFINNLHSFFRVTAKDTRPPQRLQLIKAAGEQSHFLIKLTHITSSGTAPCGLSPSVVKWIYWLLTIECNVICY